METAMERERDTDILYIHSPLRMLLYLMLLAEPQRVGQLVEVCLWRTV